MVLFLVIWMTWHFEGLNSMSHCFSHRTILSRSCWRVGGSEEELMVRYTAVSSANNLTWDLRTEDGNLLIYRRKQRGPRTEPWGTPEVTGTSDEQSLSTTTVCLRPIRKDCIQFII